MALKSYHKETLNDNWYEERAPPLNGVLPRDGAKEYATTTGTDFAGASSLVPRARPRMIHEGNIDVAMRQTSSSSEGFRSVLPRPDPEQERRYLDSTHRTSFVNHFPTSSIHAVNAGAAIAAGGPGGRVIERGKAASGAMGEVFRVNPDPQRDTHAQRTWLYSVDPMIRVMHERAAAPSPSAASGGIDGGSGRQAAAPDYHRKITSITGVGFHHKGVFVDD